VRWNLWNLELDSGRPPARQNVPSKNPSDVVVVEQEVVWRFFAFFFDVAFNTHFLAAENQRPRTVSGRGPSAAEDHCTCEPEYLCKELAVTVEELV
jgi:hypothetical protein